MELLRAIRLETQKLWGNSRSLTVVAGLMLVAFLPSVAGIFFDGRTVIGAPAWLKPAKFAISSAIYAGTLAWLFRYIQVWPRFLRWTGAITAAVLVLEVGIIDIQAARGTASHFNVSSPLDAALWGTMGFAIGVLWFASIGILVAAFKQRFADRGLGWALRLGMLITVIGSATGGLMVGPTEQQRSGIARHEAPVRIGSHTVGAPDGGPGLPAVGWSSSHGDLRVPHFLGLHALQIIPLLYFLRTRRRSASVKNQTGYVFVVSLSYLSFLALLLWQALRGQSVIEPDTTTAVAFATWLVGTSLALLAVPASTNVYRSSTVRVY